MAGAAQEHGGAEGGDDSGSGDGAVGGDGQGVAGVVVEPGEDLDVGAISEAVMGEVGLPGFVGLFGFEADVGRLRFLLRFRGDQVGAPDDPVDRRSGQLDLVVVFEVPGDRVGASIETGSNELLAEPDHDLDDIIGCGVGSCSRSARSWLERSLALDPVTGDETADPRLRNVVVACDLGLWATLDDDGGDDQSGFGHPTDPCL